MILKTLYLSARERGLPTNYVYAFKKSSRFICNFIEREVLRGLKFRSEGFNQISIHLVSNPADKAAIIPFDVVCAEIGFPKAEIDRAQGAELAKLQIALLKEGLEKCAQTFAIPKDEMLQGLDRFVAQGQRNEWTGKKNVFRAEGLVVERFCKLTADAFTLRLKVTRRGAVVFDAVIFETPPDELLFEGRYRNVLIQDGKLTVGDNASLKPLWSKPLAELE